MPMSQPRKEINTQYVLQWLYNETKCKNVSTRDVGNYIGCNRNTAKRWLDDMKIDGILIDTGTTNNPLRPLKAERNENGKLKWDSPVSNRNYWSFTETGYAKIKMNIENETKYEVKMSHKTEITDDEIINEMLKHDENKLVDFVQLFSINDDTMRARLKKLEQEGRAKQLPNHRWIAIPQAPETCTGTKLFELMSMCKNNISKLSSEQEKAE